MDEIKIEEKELKDILIEIVKELREINKSIKLVAREIEVSSTEE